jgi:8-hydroxy-5-deazaflavin:NADPH oxidoreductase
MTPNDKSAKGSFGVIGAGHAGQALAITALRASRRVVVSNHSGPESLTAVVDDLGEGVTAGTVRQAASCEIVALAVPWANLESAVAGIDWDGQIVIDATNALLFPELKPAPLGGRTSSEVVADLVPGALLVKAGNSIGADVLRQDPAQPSGRRVLFVSGDHTDAKRTVIDLLDSAGFFPIDLGHLSNGGRMQQFGGPLSGHNLIREG